MDLILKTDTKFKNCTFQDLCISQNTLNAAWDFFTNTVLTSAKKHLPKQTTTKHHNSLFSCSNSSIHKQINKLYKIYYKLKKTLLQPYLPTSPFPISPDEHKTLLTLASQNLISTSSIDEHFLNNRPLNYLNELKTDIIKPMQAKQRIVSRTENNERILEFVKQRNENFKDSPTKMIDSCLERNRKAIILDKVMSTLKHLHNILHLLQRILKTIQQNTSRPLPGPQIELSQTKAHTILIPTGTNGIAIMNPLTQFVMNFIKESWTSRHTMNGCLSLNIYLIIKLLALLKYQMKC
jgi:hypothetical protein